MSLNFQRITKNCYPYCTNTFPVHKVKYKTAIGKAGSNKR